MVKDSCKLLCQAMIFSLLSFAFGVANSFANEQKQESKENSVETNVQEQETPFRADFVFALEGPKYSVLVKPSDPHLDGKPKVEEEKKEEERDRGRGQRRESSRDRDRNRDRESAEEEKKPEPPKDFSFEYAFKSPYYFSENQELMLDVVELADLYEPNLLVTLKDDILTLTYTKSSTSSTKHEVVIEEPAPTEESTDEEAPSAQTAKEEADEKPKTKIVNKHEFNKEVYVLTVDLDEDEDAGLLSHTVYQPVIIEEDEKEAVAEKDEKKEQANQAEKAEETPAPAPLPEPEFTLVDEAKSFKDKAVTFLTPVEIIENHLFAPLSIVTFFGESVQKDATTYTASSNIATRSNIKKLSQIKNETKEIERAPEFLSRENFELIYAMIGPAGTAIVVLVLIATYLCLKNFYYLTFVWFQFIRNYKKLDNECFMFDENMKTRNPLVQLVKEIGALKIKDSTALRTEISFIFSRNFEMVVQDLSYIRLISVISPLLGLLGTVLGMVDVFQAIAESASPDPAELAQGIWSALLTTILGLSVAVPTLVAYYYLILKYKRYQNRMIKFTRHISESCPEDETK